MKVLPISVCMISGAEEARIERALASVAGWTSEIIVVLNEEVCDRTEEIARRRGAKVFREAWKGYVGQNNSAAEKATQDWILGLDADEVVSPELQQDFERLLAEPEKAKRCAAYQFPRCTLYAGRWIRHGDWYPDRKVRLWQRRRARWDGIDPHSRITADGITGELCGELLHYSMENMEHQVKKMLHYAQVFAESCGAQGKRVGILDLVVRPPWRFIRSFIFKLGFLDGWQGFCIAWMTAIYTFLRYLRALEAQATPTR